MAVPACRHRRAERFLAPPPCVVRRHDRHLPRSHCAQAASVRLSSEPGVDSPL